MANRSRGRKVLGYLKADVDNLGSLFVYGLRDNQADRNSISRIATMSRMLDLFFSGRVEQLLNIQFNLCYTVYSGGDDLLIVGPWNEIVDFAVTVQDDFRKFTNQNENVTISAGISLLKPGIPVSRSVMSADAALEESKERVLKGEIEGRDQLSLLGKRRREALVMTFVKYGKLGEEYALSDYPFKHPLLMIKAGCVFFVNGAVKPFYGQMVESIAPTHPEVLQYALAFSIPVRLEVKDESAVFICGGTGSLF